MKYAFVDYALLHAVVYVYGMACLMVAGVLTVRPRLLSKILVLKRHWRAVAVFLLLSCFNAFCFHATLYLIGLTGLAALGRLSSVMMIISGVVMFGERLGRGQIILIGVTILSAFLFSFSDTIVSANKWGILTGVLAAASWAMVNITVKKFSQEINGIGLVCLRVPFMALAFACGYFVMHQAGMIAVLPVDIPLVHYGVFAVAAFFMVILSYALFPIAMRMTDMSVVAIINALQPGLGFVAGIAFFAEPVDMFKLIAAAIAIVAGLVYSGHSAYVKRRVILPPRS